MMIFSSVFEGNFPHTLIFVTGSLWCILCPLIISSHDDIISSYVVIINALTGATYGDIVTNI